MCRLNATIVASSASDKTVDRGSFGPVFKSSTVWRLRHFATVFGLMPSLLAQLRERSLRSLYCSSDGVRGRGAPMTNLSHNASFHSCERIAPSNLGIKHLREALLGMLPKFKLHCTHDYQFYILANIDRDAGGHHHRTALSGGGQIEEQRHVQ